MLEDVLAYIYVQRSVKSACASAQCDKSLQSLHEETLHPWLYKMRPSLS